MALIIWRHPKPLGAEGICLGHTDLPVDPRRIRRLADRIQRSAKKQQLPAVIHVSPLQRSRQVGEHLANQGWKVQVDPELIEFNFGAWDGLPWEAIDYAEMDDWCADFANYAPGGKENLQQLFSRVENWLKAHQGQNPLVVGHAGWINAARLLCSKQPLPLTPTDWPTPLRYAEQLALIYSQEH